MQRPTGEIGSRVSVLRSVCPEREQCEAELLGAGVALSLPQRCAWARALGGQDSWFLAARDNSGSCQGGVEVEVARSRALPYHLLLRVPRCGPFRSVGAIKTIFAALAELARRNSRVLRVNVELFSPDIAFRTLAGESLADLGFRPLPEPRGYATTLSVDLSPSEETLCAELSQNTRRKIRAIGKHGWEVRLITDASLSARMEAMRKATMERTGGHFVPRDWGPVISFCLEHPALARLVGLFRTSASAPDSLLAYAWGLHHTDHAQYHTSASVRDETIKVPLAYGLIWDLICWAKRHGAEWFDLGGVTPGQFGDQDDPLGGISDFKRSFSKTLLRVGDEWEWEPHPTRAKLARAISVVAHWFARRG